MTAKNIVSKITGIFTTKTQAPTSVAQILSTFTAQVTALEALATQKGKEVGDIELEIVDTNLKIADLKFKASDAELEAKRALKAAAKIQSFLDA